MCGQIAKLDELAHAGGTLRERCTLRVLQMYSRGRDSVVSASLCHAFALANSERTQPFCKYMRVNR